MLTPQEVSNHAFAKAVMGGYNMASMVVGARSMSSLTS